MGRGQRIAALCILAASLAGCVAGAQQGRLAAQVGPAVYYRGDHGDQFVARYGSLADDSLHFAKVRMPDGREYTLPQAVSASGVRYTDDRELIWWTHQQTVRVEVRDAEGNWQILYPELKEMPTTVERKDP